MPRQDAVSRCIGGVSFVGASILALETFDGKWMYTALKDIRTRCETRSYRTDCPEWGGSEIAAAGAGSLLFNLGLPILAGIFASRVAANMMGQSKTITHQTVEQKPSRSHP